MFFLKDLPSRRMVEGYAGVYGVSAEPIVSGLATMRRASLMIRRLDGYFADHGLSQLRFLILIVVDREPDRHTLTIGEITERLDVAGPVIARTLRVLLDDWLVDVVKDPQDARVKHVGLTSSGHATLKALLPGYFAIIAEEMQEARHVAPGA